MSRRKVQTHHTNLSCYHEHIMQKEVLNLFALTHTELSTVAHHREGTIAVRCASTFRTARTDRSHRVQSYCNHGCLLILSAHGRNWHHRQQHGDEANASRLSPTCKTNAASLRTYASTASPLRLSGDPPDSRSGGTVRVNTWQRARCEDATER